MPSCLQKGIKTRLIFVPQIMSTICIDWVQIFQFKEKQREIYKKTPVRMGISRIFFFNWNSSLHIGIASFLRDIGKNADSGQIRRCMIRVSNVCLQNVFLNLKAIVNNYPTTLRFEMNSSS